MDNLAPIIQLDHVTKAFHSNVVLKDVSLSFAPGKVHAIVGENGAGKSTLTKIICGVYQKDGGDMLFNGEKVEFKNVSDAHKLGIRMVYQELYLMNDLSVAQNIFIGREIRKGFIIDDKAMVEKAQALFDEYGIAISPSAPVKELSVAQMQMVEILKNISQEASVLVLDEPTTALSSKEVEDLFKMIRKLQEKGVCIIYISHKMDEILAIADSITVLRDGVMVRTLRKEEATRDLIIQLMVGRQIFSELKSSSEIEEGAPIALRVNKIRSKALHDVSFTLRKGEILGFAGLMGSGRTEVARAIFGADKVEILDMEINGEKASIRSPTDAINHGICYLSEDRKQFGLMLDQSIYSNESISSLEENSRFFLLDDACLEKRVEGYRDELKIKYGAINDPIRYLSGGNQQKCILARWLLKDCGIFIFDEPTKGIDIGAKSEIYAKIKELAKNGKSIILISSELKEIMSLADEVAIMCEGKLAKILDISECSQEAIMEYAVRRKRE